MRKKGFNSLESILKKISNKPKLKNKLEAMEVLDNLDNILGNNLTKYIINKYFQKGIIYLNLSSSAGVYSNGDGKNLGNALQFKSEVNLFYKLGKSSRIGLGSHHISNAGLSSVNPGTNNFYLIFNQDF